jgi:4-carboxymuconolactone decarboxylase
MSLRGATILIPGPGYDWEVVYHSREAGMSEIDRNDGRAMRRKLLGDAFVEKAAATVYQDPQMQKFVDLASETVFGALWTRPGLDLKTRTLVTVISDASTGREAELAIHLRMARRQGWTEDELVEALLHLLGYVGAPLVRDAMLVATKTFAGLRAEGVTS